MAVIAFAAQVTPAFAQAVSQSDWGALGQLAGFRWYTTMGDPRLSIAEWEAKGETLVIRHGTVTRMTAGAKYADIVQRVSLGGKLGSLVIRYTYEDGHTLDSKAQVQPNGNVVELYVDKEGVQQRNTYTVEGKRALIARAKFVGGSWLSSGTTIKTGTTLAEERQQIADRKQKAELAQAERDAAEEAREARENAAQAQRQVENDAVEAQRDQQQQAAFQRLSNMADRSAEAAHGSDAMLQAQIARSRAIEAQRAAERLRDVQQKAAQQTADAAQIAQQLAERNRTSQQAAENARAAQQAAERARSAQQASERTRLSQQSGPKTLSASATPAQLSRVAPAATKPDVTTSAKPVAKTVTVNIVTVNNQLEEGIWRRVIEVAGVTIDVRYRHELRDQVITEFKITNSNDYDVYFSMAPKYLCRDGSSQGGTVASGDIGAHRSTSNGMYEYVCKPGETPGAAGFNSISITPK